MTDRADRPAPPQRFQPSEPLAEAEIIRLLGRLRRKEGTWVEWGQACAQLQRSGMGGQEIFEETGFEPIQQNQVIVAAQVYRSLQNRLATAGPESEALLDHFGQRGSDVLYELRVLSEGDRIAAAELAWSLKLDCDEAHELARALKEYSLLGEKPEGFSEAPGDVLAWQSWRTARQQTDLQVRSRAIARGLRFAQTPAARSQLEKLLLDFAVVNDQKAPRLPLYRIDSDEEEPRLLAVAGKLPLPVEDFKAVPLIEAEGSFGLVRFTGTGAWVALPNWQVLRQAQDPIALLCDPSQLPAPLPDDRNEEILLVVDRSDRTWNDESFFAHDHAGDIALEWFAQDPSLPAATSPSDSPAPKLLGKVILVLRPKRFLDESYTQEWWQIDE